MRFRRAIAGARQAGCQRCCACTTDRTRRSGCTTTRRISTVYVYLNDSGPVRFEHTGRGQAVRLVRPPTHAGAFRVSPGRIERHSVENLSDLPSDYLRIELKQVSARHASPASFAVRAEAAAGSRERQVAYASPQLRIDRIICPSTGDCQLHYPNRDVLLIRFRTTRSARRSPNGRTSARMKRFLEPRAQGLEVRGRRLRSVPGPAH